MEQSDKTRISADFVIFDIVLIAIIGLMILLLTDYRRTSTNSIVSYIFIVALCSILLISTLNIPEYYFDSKFLYVEKSGKIKRQIPLEAIQSITFSTFGHSYKIRFVDNSNELGSERIYTNPFLPFSKFIKAVKQQNPDVYVRRWTVGFNELTD